MNLLHEIEARAIEWSKVAGAGIRSRLGRVAVDRKGVVDLVTEADRESEWFLLERIGAAFPEHSLWAEESGQGQRGGAYRWIIDPLDGTTNFAHQIPHFAVLMAVQKLEGADYETVVACTYDPMRDELFSAVRGEGARLDGEPIAVSTIGTLASASGATGFAYDRWERDDDNHAEFCALNLATQGIRRFGSAGLDLAWVACGRFDFYWETGLKPWDVAGGALLVEEAGGRVSNTRGAPFDPLSGDIAVASDALHPELLRALTLARGGPINDRAALSEVDPRRRQMK